VLVPNASLGFQAPVRSMSMPVGLSIVCISLTASRVFRGYVQNGLPWAFQNGIFCGSLFHFYVHDTTGPVGAWLRRSNPLPPSLFGLDDRTYMTVAVGLFMQIMGILQMPQFLGPSYSPFVQLYNLIFAPVVSKPPPPAAVTVKKDKALQNGTDERKSEAPVQAPIPNSETDTASPPVEASTSSKSSRKRKKNKAKQA
jgi:hypothetical protein